MEQLLVLVWCLNYNRSKRQMARLFVVHINTKRRRETNKHGHCSVFPHSESLSSNSFRSFEYARGNESIIYFTDLCKPIETYIYARKKHPFASYPAAKHPNAANLWQQTYDKNQWTFFINTAWASTFAIIFKLQVP